MSAIFAFSSSKLHHQFHMPQKTFYALTVCDPVTLTFDLITASSVMSTTANIQGAVKNWTISHCN